MGTASTTKRHEGLDVPRPGHPRIVTVPRTTYLTLSGKGLPAGNGSGEFQAAIAALYGLAYTIKFTRKKEGGDLAIGAIEADWWVPGRKDMSGAPPSAFRWQLFLPARGVRVREIAAALATLEERGRATLLMRRAKLLVAPTTRVAEALHVGPYDAELPTIEAMLEHARAEGFRPIGHHREIYLGDPRRTAPERLKTLLRHPVARSLR